LYVKQAGQPTTGPGCGARVTCSGDRHRPARPVRCRPLPGQPDRPARHRAAGRQPDNRTDGSGRRAALDHGGRYQRHDPHDRRKVVVEATDLLIRREQEVFGELLGRLEQLAQTYSDAQLSIIHDFLERSRGLVVTTYEPVS
jgi:hypothetical protein